MAEKPQRRVVRTAKLVALSLTPALVLVLIAEGIATLSIWRRARTSVDPATGRSVYTMRIGKWPWSRVAVTPLNSLGFPDREFPAMAAKDRCVHIVFSGDSYVFGDGVNLDSSFVEMIRRRARARAGGPCIEVFNLGVRGTTIDRQAEKILETADRLRPDVVLLGQYQNDLIDLNSPGAILDPNRGRPGKPQGDSVRVRLGILNANIIKMLTYQSFAFMIRNSIERDVLRRWSVMADSSRLPEARRFQEVYAELFAGLVDTLAARGVAFGTFIIPSKLDVMAQRYPEEPFFLELAKRHSVPHLRLYPVFDANRNPYPFLMYDGHLNEHGNRLIADALYRWLFEQEPPPFPALRTGREPSPSPSRAGTR